MSNVQVELICDREQFEDPYKSGVTWAGKGDVQTVTAEQWEKMKKHTDVWREVVKDSLTTDEAKAAAQWAPKTTTIMVDKTDGTITVTQGEDADTDPALAEANAKIAATLADLDNMTDEAVREFAASLEVKPHHKKTGAALRDAVREALAA